MCKLDAGTIANIISVGAFVCSAIGIWQNVKQRKLSNQHHLWDKRIKQYRVLQGLLNAYQENLTSYLSGDNPVQDVADDADLLYKWLTSCECFRVCIPQEEVPTIQHKTAVIDCFCDSESIIPMLWDENISQPTIYFIQSYRKFVEILYHFSTVARTQQKIGTNCCITTYTNTPRHSNVSRKKLSDSFQNLQDAYSQCIKQNVLSLISDTLQLNKHNLYKRFLNLCNKVMQNTLPSVHAKVSLESRQNIIDIHDKRLSQLFKVCYIAAPGFASALLANANLINPDAVVKYTIPAIITATAAVVLWITKHALRAGQCYVYAEEPWEETIKHSNRTYQYALTMIKCAIIWIITVFLTVVIASHDEWLVSRIQWLGHTFTPIINLWLLISIIIVRWIINKTTNNTKIQSACTQITYFAGLLWTTQVIWNL